MREKESRTQRKDPNGEKNGRRTQMRETKSRTLRKNPDGEQMGGELR